LLEIAPFIVEMAAFVGNKVLNSCITEIRMLEERVINISIKRQLMMMWVSSQWQDRRVNNIKIVVIMPRAFLDEFVKSTSW
jgi:hypothetical protein